MSRYGLQDPFDDLSQEGTDYSPFGRRRRARGATNPEATEALTQAVSGVKPPADQPGAGADQPFSTVPPGEDVPDDSSAASRLPAQTPRTGWGFETPQGGRKEFAYTPGAYEGEIANYSGFDPGKVQGDESLKYVFLRATQGLQPTVENLDAVVARLNAQGIPARRVGYDQLDFGLGEGPIDVVNQTRGGVWDWMGGGADSAQPGPEQEALSGALGSPWSHNTQEAGDAYALIQRLMPWLFQQLGIKGALGGQ